ncbi:hypothetical protein CLOM_g7630 [Closterium sp. NIES-68]|nr:hypothetical protein CLOM_g23569 [Closterium sp. NIES-68]GJP48326.1 hypothetical protein CLOM_g7630 [Closterium sp. NIES-68]GJP65837.1 hypothetical protein CLOP_g22748 [Closterium sp. NIES-67]
MAMPAPAQAVNAVLTEPYVVVGSQYCVPYETVLILKEKMFSLREKAEIHDSQGNLIFKTEESALSLRDRKTIFNSKDEPVCTIISKVFSLHNTTYLCSGTSTDVNEALLTARSKFFSFAPILNIFLKGNTSDNPDIVLKGSIAQHQFDIATSKGVILAQVQRDIWSAKEFLATQSYSVRIKPHADVALIMGLVAMADEIFVNEETK